MGSPYNISGSASRLFFQNKASAEFKALSVIAESLVHPQRTLLSAFVLHAVDREVASQFFLGEISGQGKAAVLKFLTDWIALLIKVRPAVCSELEESLRQNIWRRDQGQCCISKVGERKKNDGRLLLTHILSPSLFYDGDVPDNERFHKMLAAFIGEPQLQDLRLLMGQDSPSADRDVSERLILLSPQIFEYFRTGRLSLKGNLSVATKDSAEYLVEVRNYLPFNHVEMFNFVTLENKAIGVASLANAQLLEVHHQFADALAWLQVSEYMKQDYNLSSSLGLRNSTSFTSKAAVTKSPWEQWYLRPITQMFQYAWLRTPVFLRVFAYKRLAWISYKLYRDTGSDRICRLPCNFYLRMAGSDWASKHRAEFQTLRLVENHTQVPAPRAIDTVQDSNSSFLLMTGLQGETIGRRISTMTDEQLHGVVQDLKACIAQLRQIPNRSSSDFQICNPLGDGILDWRIGDSQREELRFQDETQFHQYLTYDLPLGDDAWRLIAKSHSVKHDIVFTHADLNLRNILVDDSGRISGIVDWECAGWYPEYWEYTKAHFTVRHNIRWLADVIDQVFPNYRDELLVEDMLSSMAPSW